MKNLNKILLGGAALVLLTGCDLFKTSISADKYQEKVDKLEQHQYSEATVTVKEEIVGTGMYVDDSASIDETGKLTWNSEKGEWVPEDEADVNLKYYVYSLYGKKITDVIVTPESSTLEIENTYYSNLEVKTVIKGSVKIEEYQLETTYDKYQMNYKFDKYGWMTSYKMVCNSSTTMGTQSGTSKHSRTIKISYK